MSEIHRAGLPRVDEMRLREIEAWYEAAREEQDSLMDAAGLAEMSGLGRVVMETDATVDHFLEVAVPEMLQELGRRLGEDG